MPGHNEAIETRPAEGLRLRALRDELALRALAAGFGRASVGSLRITLPSGRTAVLSARSSRQGVEAAVTVTSLRALWRTIRHGVMGVADSYIRGEIETRCLPDLFRFYLDNAAAVARPARGMTDMRLVDRLVHLRRVNTRAGSRRNIAAHYDLGNDFYAHWLDAGMTYSSAIYRTPEATLEAAQDEKIRAVLAALPLAPGASVLEIGCGWGGLAEAAARSGAEVTAITVSAAQEAFARARLSAAGLGERASIRFEDYRDTAGAFDHVVSIEMIEAVGEANWPAYFKTLHDRLKPGGTGVIQAVTIDEPHFEGYRRTPDFIQKYIFPGGMLPTVSLMRHNAEAAGLTLETVERFGASYAVTLAAWQERFDRAWPEIARLGFDDRFRRMWTYYLSYCAVGFERGVIDVGLYRVRRPA